MFTPVTVKSGRAPLWTPSAFCACTRTSRSPHNPHREGSARGRLRVQALAGHTGLVHSGSICADVAGGRAIRVLFLSLRDALRDGRVPLRRILSRGLRFEGDGRQAERRRDEIPPHAFHGVAPLGLHKTSCRGSHAWTAPVPTSRSCRSTCLFVQCYADPIYRCCRVLVVRAS